MKKIFCLLVAVCMLFCAVGCRKVKTNSSKPSTADSSIVTSAVENNSVVEDLSSKTENDNITSEEVTVSKIEQTHTHSFTNATCTVAKTCTICGVIQGTVLGHSYAVATCTTAKTCTRCGLTEGNALGHSYTEATCTKPKICTICGATSGSALGYPDIYGKWYVVYYNDGCKKEEESYYQDARKCVDYTFFEFNKEGFDFFDMTCNSDVTTILYSNRESGEKLYPEVTYNSEKYYPTPQKGGGSIGCYFENNNDTITVFPIYDEVGGGNLYEKIVLKFNDAGNLVITELVGCKDDGSGYFSRVIEYLRVGLEFRKA